MGIISRLFERRTHPSQPASWLIEALGGMRSAAGVDVTPESSLKSTAVYACVRILAETVASLPLILYRRLERGKERAHEHSLYRVLHDLPNPEMTSFELREVFMGHLALRGNAYGNIVWSRGGAVKEIWPLRPDRMRVERRDGVLRYYYTLPDGTERVLNARDVWHIKGFGNGLVGYSPIALAREAVGLALATEEYGARFFSNNSRPGGVLETDGRLSDEAFKRLKKSWEEAHSGLSNAHRVAILEEGVHWKQVGIAPEDAQYLDTRKFQTAEIARIFRIPPHMIGDLDRATFCLPADVEVFTEHGPKSIADIQVGERVWSLGSNGWVLAPVTRSACTGEDEILTIRTRNRILRANAKHRVLVRRKHEVEVPPHSRGGLWRNGKRYRVEWRNKWIPAGEIKVGDILLTPSMLPVCGTDPEWATEQFIEFCGLFLGDGSIRRRNGIAKAVTIARPQNASYMDYYRQSMLAIGERYEGRKTQLYEAEAAYQTEMWAPKLAAFLEEIGLNGNAHTKTIPGWVFTLSDNLRLAFLRGFLDADGHVTSKGTATFVSCNERLLSQLRHLCMSLGISVSNLRYRCKQGFGRYQFDCSDPQDVLRIGSHTPEYILRAQAAVKRPKRYSKNYAYTRHNAFAELNTEWLALSSVINIEHNPAKEPVYDLEVANTHSFIANGVVVHNSNIEHQSIEFVMHTIVPWLRRWEQSIHRDLLVGRERDQYFAEFLVDGLLRGDIKSRYEAYAIGRQNGWLSANDIREMENKNPIENGDVYLVPLNMIPADSLTAAAPEPQEPAGRSVRETREARARRYASSRRQVAHSYRQVFVDAAARVIRRERADIMREAKKNLGRRGIDDFEVWLEEFYREHEEFVRKNMEPAHMALAEATQALAAEEIGAEPGMSDSMRSFMDAYLTAFVARHIQSSLGQLRSILRLGPDEETVLEALRQRFDEWEEKRPGKIAMWETVRTSNAVAKETWAENGVIKLRWNNFNPSCPYCQDLDGTVVGIHEHFIEPHVEFQPDGADKPLVNTHPVGHAPAHEGCDCQISPVL